MTRQYDWDKLIKQLKVPTDPRLDVRIEALIEQSKTSNRSRAEGQRRLLHLHSRLIKYAAAAVVLAAVLLSLKAVRDSRPPYYTIRQTVEALNSVSSVQMPVTNCSMGSEMVMLINPQTGRPDHLRLENPDTGDVTITIPGQTYACNREKNEVTLIGRELLSIDLDFKQIFSSIVENKNAIGGEIEILQAFSELADKDVILVNILRKNKTIAGKVLIDPKTRLPMYIGMDAGGQLSYMGPFRYNIDIEKDTFEFSIPSGFKVIDTRPEELKTTDRPELPAGSSKTPYGRHGRVTFEDEE